MHEKANPVKSIWAQQIKPIMRKLSLSSEWENSEVPKDKLELTKSWTVLSKILVKDAFRERNEVDLRKMKTMNNFMSYRDDRVKCCLGY